MCRLSLLDEARTYDSQDALACFRQRFYLLEGRIYLDGNSLGLLSVDAERAVLQALQEWRYMAIDGWLDANPPWFYYGEKLGMMMAPLVGAEPDEVCVTGQTTVNLHALVLSFLQSLPFGKRNILADSLNFPSDLYALAGDAALFDSRLRLVGSDDGRYLDESDIVQAMTPDTGVVVLPSVLYRSGQLLDIEGLCKVARDRGVIIGFDSSHSVGVVPHLFSKWGVDFAFWCTYKYANGGPGSAGALYVNPRHWHITPALPGWWGHRKDTQFEMSISYTKASGAGAWQIGTPNILGSAALLGSLELINAAGINQIRQKSLAQTGFLMRLIDETLSPLGFSLGTPQEPSRRGGHVALRHPNAFQICQAIRQKGVIPDFRPPNIIRLAPSPLYTSFEDIARAVCVIRDVTESGAYRSVEQVRRAVT